MFIYKESFKDWRHFFKLCKLYIFISQNKSLVFTMYNELCFLSIPIFIFSLYFLQKVTLIMQYDNQRK